MNLLPRYFTPSLIDEDRYDFYDFLGLAEFRYIFIESYKNIIIRKSKVCGTNVSIDFWNDERINEDIYIINFYNNDGSFIRRNILEETSIWEELFPAPFSQLALGFRDYNKFKLETTPPELLLDLELLYAALKDLEKKLCAFEVSLVKFISENKGERAFIFHYVRKKRQRIGNANNIYEYWKEAFSAQKGFYNTLTLTLETTLNPIMNLTQSLKKVLAY